MILRRGVVAVAMVSLMAGSALADDHSTLTDVDLNETDTGAKLEAVLGEDGGETTSEGASGSDTGGSSSGPEMPGTQYVLVPGATNEESCYFTRTVELAGMSDVDRGHWATTQREHQRAIQLNSLSYCDWYVPPVTAQDFVPSLTDQVGIDLDSPAISVQPGNRPLAGKPSYLEPMAMSWTRDYQLSFTRGGVTYTPTATVTGEVVEYWVDWEWQGHGPDQIVGYADVGGRSVSGPHHDAPYAWEDGEPGNVGWTYRTSGPKTVAIVAVWRISATIEDYGAVTPVTLTAPVSTIDVDVRQAQAVRRS